MIPREHMPTLKVSVAMGRATHFIAADKLSKYENYEVLYEISQGRLAGAVDGDLS
jgi:tyrosinase